MKMTTVETKRIYFGSVCVYAFFYIATAQVGRASFKSIEKKGRKGKERGGGRDVRGRWRRVKE